MSNKLPNSLKYIHIKWTYPRAECKSCMLWGKTVTQEFLMSFCFRWSHRLWGWAFVVCAVRKMSLIISYAYQALEERYPVGGVVTLGEMRWFPGVKSDTIEEHDRQSTSNGWSCEPQSQMGISAVPARPTTSGVMAASFLTTDSRGLHDSLWVWYAQHISCFSENHLRSSRAAGVD